MIIKTVILLVITATAVVFAQTSEPEAAVQTEKNCGTETLLPGAFKPVSSHVFFILGLDSKNHIIADYRSDVSPQNFQTILRLRLDDAEMAAYKKLAKESKQIPVMMSESSFCLKDIATDDSIFPLKMTLHKNVGYDGALEALKVQASGSLSLNKEDIDVIVQRELPSFINQENFRKEIQERSAEIVPLLETFTMQNTYMQTDGAVAEKNGSCPKDPLLSKVAVPKTIHNFLILGEADNHTILAVHMIDQAPHNYQAVVKIKLLGEYMTAYRKAKKDSKAPLLLQTQIVDEKKRYYFCMAHIKKTFASKNYFIEGAIYKDSNLNDYKLGPIAAKVPLAGKDLQVVAVRSLPQLLNPVAVGKDVLGSKYEEFKK